MDKATWLLLHIIVSKAFRFPQTINTLSLSLRPSLPLPRSLPSSLSPGGAFLNIHLCCVVLSCLTVSDPNEHLITDSCFYYIASCYY